jgi:ComF family protein
MATLPSICYVCGKASRSFKPCPRHIGAKKPQRVFIHSPYKDEIRQLLHSYKFDYKRAAAYDIARLIDDYLPYFADPPLITFVPTIGGHVRQRSFDHAKLIAKELAKRRQWPYAALLYKNKNVSQTGKTRAERKKQLEGAVVPINTELIKNSHILLIDDVITTGATVEACTEILVKAGALEVDVAVLARTP